MEPTDNTQPEAMQDTISDEITVAARLRAEYQERYEKLFGSEADAATASKKIISGNLQGITSELVKSALHSVNERVRVDAAKYILDRMVFKAGATDDEMKEFLSALSKGAEKS